jgi:hypothetical protein
LVMSYLEVLEVVSAIQNLHRIECRCE